MPIVSSPIPRLRSPLRPLCSTLALSLMLGVATTARAAPTGEVITGGSGSVERSGQVTSILQNSNRLAIDWDNFDIAADERVTFVQPDASSIALNRVLSNDPSRIAGQLDANGRIILTNPNGVIFSGGASVNVGSLIASGLDINADDFMAGDLDFAAVENTDGIVINRGLIQAAAGGNVALLGKQVNNEGVINAQMGTISLNAAEEAVVTFDDSGMLGVQITRDALEHSLGVDPAVINSGNLNAHQVIMSSRTSADLFSDAVNHGQPAHLDVTVHDDGSFSLARSVDVINTGRIVASADASSEGSSVAIHGTDVMVEGQIRVDGSRTENSGAAVDVDATSSVAIRSAIINSPSTSAANRIDINGRYLKMTREARIHMGTGSLEMGERDHTKIVYIGPNARIHVADNNASSTPASTGGDVAIHADYGIHARGKMRVQGGTQTSDGPRLLLDSGDLLGFSSDLVLGTAAATGDMIFNARDIVIGQATSPRRVSVASLGRGVLNARAELNAQNDIIGYGKSADPEWMNRSHSLTLHHDLVLRAGLENPAGRLDMSEIALNYVSGETSSPPTKNLVLQGASLNLPAIGTDGSPINLDLLTTNGNIFHAGPVNTFGGDYSAVASGDVEFKWDSHLNTTGGDGVQPGSITMDGRRVSLSLDSAWQNDADLPLVADLSGQTVEVTAFNAAIDMQVEADSLSVEGDGRVNVNGVAKWTWIDSSGGQWALDGDFTWLGFSVRQGGSINVTDINDLWLTYVNLSGSEGSVTLDNQHTLVVGRLRDLPIDPNALPLPSTVSDSSLVVEAGDINFDADFRVYGGGEGLTVRFARNLALNNVYSFYQPDESASAPLIKYMGPEEGGAQVTVGANISNSDTDASTGTIYLYGGGNTVDMASSLPSPVRLGEGADTIRLLAPDLDYELLGFDGTLDTLIPFNGTIDTAPELPVLTVPASNARPAGGAVTDGSGVIDYFQRATRIQQSSDQLAIDWNSFDIGDNHRVVFYQPDSQSVAFNRVLSNDPTRIYGELTANGRVVITSPGGIAIGKNASVNVGGLVASSLMLPTAGVPDSVWTFDAGANSGAVINLADIMVTSGGDVALLGAAVANDGVIQIDQGSVTLASASQATIDPGNLEEPLRVTVTEAAEGPALLDAAVMNLGDILTPAGFVSLLSRPLTDGEAQAIDTTGVTLKDNGSFEVAGAPDVYIGGTIDIGGAVAAEYFPGGGGFRFAGTDVQLAGKVLVGAYLEEEFDEWQYEERGYGWPASPGSDLHIDASRSVVITGTVQSRPANENTLDISAPYIGIEDGGTLSIGLGELTLGQPESTHRIFAGASTTIAADSWLGEFGPMYGTGGRITLDAQESIVLNGLVAANSRSDNSYQSYLDGGEITVNSQGKLGVHGALGAGSGARGTPGHITLRGEQLTLSDSDDTYVVSAQSLNAAALRGDVTLDGASSVVVDSESPVNVSMYRSLFIRAGRPGHPGDLDLSGLVIDNDSYRNSSVYIEGHNIIAPELASVVGRALNVFITATGDLYHPTRVFTTGGNYIAVVGGDITFAPEAVLATRSYGPGYKTHLEAGGDIDLRVGVNTSHEEDVTFVSPVPTTVIGDQVRVWVPKGEVDLNVQADTLWLAGGGRLQGKAQVDGFAHLDMAPGSAWTLTGDIGGVDVSFPGILVGPTHSVGGTLNIQDKGSLLLGDVSASNSAVINIRTDAEGRITQLTDTAINLERSKLHLGGGRGITLGAAGVFLDEFEFTQFTVDYGTDLVLDGPITQSAPGNLVRFNTTRPNQKTNVTVGENFSLAVGNKPAGSIKVGNAGSIINLAAYMPLPFMLGAGADVINLLSAYAGGVFIKQGQTNTINPYVPNQVQLDSQRSDPLSQLWSVDESFKWTVSVPDRLAVERSISESGADQPRTSNHVSYMPWSGL